MSDPAQDPDPERFDGLTKSEALRLCVKRAFQLSLSEVDFVTKMGAKKKPLRSDEVLRLRHIVLRFRQDDLEARLREGDDDAAA